ncbi:MAG: carbohydrate-binding domain-containing protein [Janthinobacterium lividum]
MTHINHLPIRSAGRAVLVGLGLISATAFHDQAYAMATDTLVLNMSEDAYNGDALFSVAVDGVQVNNKLTATALHSAGASQNFMLLGSWGTGKHVVTVKFLNDLYGGSAAKDRNLYVNMLTFDGSTTIADTKFSKPGSVSFNIQTRNVFVGGDFGFANLTTASVANLLATGRGGVYIHGSAVSAATAAVDRGILTAFQPYGGGVFEAGQNGFFDKGNAYDSYLAASGWVPQYINLNLGGSTESYTASDLKAVKVWMDNVRSRAALSKVTIAPFATPGGNAASLGGTFGATDKVWGNLAKACLYGGAIAIDIPATNFISLGAGWPEFIEAQIRWGIANGIRTSIVFSPGDSPTFVEDVAAAVTKLVAANAIPTDYSVENYTGAGAVIANTGTASESLNAAAFWLAQNAPVTVIK